MASIAFTQAQRDFIKMHVESRIKSCAGVLTPEYQAHFLSDRTAEQLAEIVAEREAELDMLYDLLNKLEDM